MTLANMSMTLALIPCAAHLADKGLPKLAATGGVLVVAAVGSIPMLLAVSSQSLVAAWLMQVRFSQVHHATITRAMVHLAVRTLLPTSMYNHCRT